MKSTPIIPQPTTTPLANPAMRLLRRALMLSLLSALLVIAFQPMWAQTETVLYSFKGGATDGAEPEAGVVRDSKGNLYGTTNSGGASGVGTVFEFTAASGIATVLYPFKGGATDGGYPIGGVVRDGKGNIFGATEIGNGGDGTILKVTKAGNETILQTFTGEPDGAYPFAGVVRDSQDNLYGTTYEGGTFDAGAIFEVTAAGAETVLYSFQGGSDGANPYASLVRDSNSNLYGTTQRGGTSGFGTVFEVSPNGSGGWNETVLHSFEGGTDGEEPLADLVRDGQGNLYGVTNQGGGSANCSGGCGTVFELTAAGAEKILYSFQGGSDGATPRGGLVRYKGNIYGTTSSGGAYDRGTLFELTKTGNTYQESILHSFGLGSDGVRPNGDLIVDSKGNLYSTTVLGGAHGLGTVFELTP